MTLLANLPTLEAVQAERARRSLRTYIELAWPIIEPNRAFVPNWHIDAIAEHLEAVTRGEITRILINVPPGCMKSALVSVLWTTWEWAAAPALRYLTASYTDGLTIRDSLKVRDIVLSDWYQTHFGSRVQLRPDQNQKIRMNTTAGGWRIATSVGGLGTGEHPDRVIIDDAHKAKGSESDNERQSVLDWFDGTISSRGVSRGVRLVAVGQRLHQKDLSGHLLEKGTWVHICLPMRAEPNRMPTTPLGWNDPREADELLWPDLFPEPVVHALERDLGSAGTAGQLQQRPAPREGALIKRHLVEYFHPSRPPARVTDIVLSCDPNQKAKAKNDFAVIDVWARVGADAFLLKKARGRFEYPELLRQATDMYRWARQTYPRASMVFLIENAAAGPEMIADLRRQLSGIIPVNQDVDKERRVSIVTPMFESGNVWVPGASLADHSDYDRAITPDWVQNCVEQWCNFPTDNYDDDVDTMTQALRRIQQMAGGAATPSGGHNSGDVESAPQRF